MLSLGPKAGDGARAPRPTAGEVDQTVTTLDDGTATNPDWPTRCASAERMPNTRGSLNVALRRIREHDCRRVGLAGSFQAPDGEPDRERVELVHGSPDSSSHHRVNRSRSTASTASGAAGTPAARLLARSMFRRTAIAASGRGKPVRPPLSDEAWRPRRGTLCCSLLPDRPSLAS